MNAIQAITQAIVSAPVAVAPVKDAAQKVAKKTVSKVAKPAALAIPFGIHDGSRPGQGRALFELTHAWLSLSGMASGKAYPVSQARQVAGNTCVSYHTGNGNFALADGMLKLTPKGQEFFKARAAGNSAEKVAAFVEVLKTGKVNETAGVKNKDVIKAIKA